MDCTSGPHDIKDGTARASKNVLMGDADRVIPLTEKEMLQEAASKAVAEAVYAIKGMRKVCKDPCVPRILPTLSDYRVQNETGHFSGSVGAIAGTVSYLVSAEVDWTVDLLCEKQDPANPPPASSALAETLAPGGCKSKRISGVHSAPTYTP